MARLILKAPYYKPGHKTESGKSRGGYAEYIATREGVEILRGGMLGYIGDRQGSNGLFSDEGEKINLSAIKREIDEHQGNVWGIIISLRREDAERLGYNSAEQWINLLRSRRNDIAKEMNILPSNLRWYAAYHNKETNPHVHIMVWSKEPREPFLSREGIHNLKQTFASDIFRQELTSIYKKQTEVRDDLKEKYKSTIAKVVAEIKNGDHAVPPELVMKMQLLSEKLEKHKGKKVYGYLPKETKALVNEIVKMLGNDPQLSELYESWYGYKCETVRTYTDIMPDKIPIEENEEFKSIRNAVVSAVRDIHTPPEQPDYAVDYDYSKLKEHKDDFDYLYGYANRYDDPIGYYRLGRYYLEKTDDMENAEWWLRMAADNGNSLSAYLIYKAYRDHKFDETPSDMMKYLRKAADAGFGYAEYEYAKYLKDKSPEDAKEYFRRAAEHGCNQAEYAYGKMLFEEGRREEARAYFERSAEDDEWTQTRVGLLLYYEYEDYDAGKEYIHKAAEAGYEPAKEAIRAINNNLNAQIVIGVCDLFYHASRIIEDEAEDMYAEEQHQVNYHGIDKKQRREIRAKKQAQGHTMSW